MQLDSQYKEVRETRASQNLNPMELDLSRHGSREIKFWSLTFRNLWLFRPWHNTTRWRHVHNKSVSITTVYLCNYARKLGYSCKRQMRTVEVSDNRVSSGMKRSAITHSTTVKERQQIIVKQIKSSKNNHQKVLFNGIQEEAKTNSDEDASCWLLGLNGGIQRSEWSGRSCHQVSWHPRGWTQLGREIHQN